MGMTAIDENETSRRLAFHISDQFKFDFEAMAACA
jgi:hypothetical protein